jgi:hypothetical protein
VGSVLGDEDEARAGGYVTENCVVRAEAWKERGVICAKHTDTVDLTLQASSFKIYIQYRRGRSYLCT